MAGAVLWANFDAATRCTPAGDLVHRPGPPAVSSECPHLSASLPVHMIRQKKKKEKKTCASATVCKGASASSHVSNSAIRSG
jgi:hypothetical protein